MKHDNGGKLFQQGDHFGIPVTQNSNNKAGHKMPGLPKFAVGVTCCFQSLVPVKGSG